MKRCQSCGAQTTRKWERGGVWCAACFKAISAKVVDIFDFRMRRNSRK